jgi:hypothetical protein
LALALGGRQLRRRLPAVAAAGGASTSFDSPQADLLAGLGTGAVGTGGAVDSGDLPVPIMGRTGLGDLTGVTRVAGVACIAGIARSLTPPR